MLFLSPYDVYSHDTWQTLTDVQDRFSSINYVWIPPIFSLHLLSDMAGPRSAVGRAPDSLVRGPGFDTRSGHILSFLLPLIQEGQMSVTGESMCMKYWLTA